MDSSFRAPMFNRVLEVFHACLYRTRNICNRWPNCSRQGAEAAQLDSSRYLLPRALSSCTAEYRILEPLCRMFVSRAFPQERPQHDLPMQVEPVALSMTSTRSLVVSHPQSVRDERWKVESPQGSRGQRNEALTRKKWTGLSAI